jgi:enolase-phosphatase E1
MEEGTNVVQAEDMLNGQCYMRISFTRPVADSASLILQFPYALAALPKVLQEQWDAPEFAQYRQAFPAEHNATPEALEAHVRDLVRQDLKIPYLKALQGHLWRTGYQSGEIKAPLFADVAPSMAAARAADTKIMIYSSGSVPAQKLLFGHTDADPADLTPYICDWFDTVNAGPKTDVASYNAILANYPNIDPTRWLFLSDNLKEVDAAWLSGMRSLPVVRPGNAPLPAEHALSRHAIPDFTAESLACGRASIEEIAQASS